jgi:hypothetical protein
MKLFIYILISAVLSVATLVSAMATDNLLTQQTLFSFSKVFLFFVGLFSILRVADKIIGKEFLVSQYNQNYYAVRFLSVALSLAWILS